MSLTAELKEPRPPKSNHMQSFFFWNANWIIRHSAKILKIRMCLSGWSLIRNHGSYHQNSDRNNIQLWEYFYVSPWTFLFLHLHSVTATCSRDNFKVLNYLLWWQKLPMTLHPFFKMLFLFLLSEASFHFRARGKYFFSCLWQHLFGFNGNLENWIIFWKLMMSFGAHPLGLKQDMYHLLREPCKKNLHSSFPDPSKWKHKFFYPQS